MTTTTKQLRDTMIEKGYVVREKEGQVEEILGYRTGTRIDLERACLITESYKMTEGEPEVLRRAKALAHILDNMTIYIRAGEQIVGNFASDPASLNIFPELAVEWPDDIINRVPKEALDDEGRRVWREEIYSYWKGRSIDDRVMAVLPDSLRNHVEFDGLSRATAFRASLMTVVPNYEKVLQRGLRGIVDEIQGRLATLKANIGDMHPTDYVDQRSFLEAALMACEAVVRFANRFADKALEMARGEQNPKRVKGLEEVAEVCRRVPEYPARNLYEAMQSLWFILLVSRMIETRCQESGARFDQLMYPFYKEDTKEGRISRERAQELMEFFLVKLNECNHLERPEAHVHGAGAAIFQTLTIGGVTPDGTDATNEFSFVMLDAAIAMQTPHTNIALRYHSKVSPALISRAIDAVRTGLGYPVFFNDGALIPMILDRGIPLEDARDYVIGGCVTWVIPGKNEHNHRASAGVVSLGKCLELALNQGRDRFTGKQMGCPTADPRTFTSFEDIKEAFFEQVDVIIGKLSGIINMGDDMFVRYMPLPFMSAVVDGCIERGQDLNGWTYHAREKWLVGGATNVADSLAAIKKFVFEEKKLTLEELLEVLKTNYEGKEEIRQMLLSAPKFGNDDDYVDNINSEIHNRIQAIAEQYQSWWGSPWSIDGSIAGGYYHLGKRAAASADGRKDRESFADGTLSPMAGADRKGPTAVLKSMGKVTPRWSELTNQKFMPQFLEGEYKQQFAAYLKTWADLGNSHIQFNVVSRETLLDAQAHPEKYSNLIVRVAGYSAYFTDLSKGVQDDIIARSYQKF